MTIIIDDTTARDYFESYLLDNREHRREMRENEQSMRTILLHARRRRVLNAREYELLKMRFFERRTLEEVAKKYGVLRERVRQIEAKALDKLKQIPGSEVRNA
jgi:RNA polymerase primary sigma factor